MTEPAWLVGTDYPDGDASLVRYAIETVTLQNGQSLELTSPGVTAVVGANNSGKSTFLRQLNYQLVAPSNLQSEPTQLIQSVVARSEGSRADFLAWCGKHSAFKKPDRNMSEGQLYRGDKGSLPVGVAYNLWQTGAGAPNQTVANFLVRYADAHSRISQIAGVAQRNDVMDPPTHPLHAMQDDSSLAAQVNDLSEAIFRQPITLDHLSGTMRLRVGRPEAAAPAANEGQAEYRAALAQLPQLDQQGDGMKSLLGLLLPLITATFPIIIVDEPEAFLHPPQAYALGNALGELSRDFNVQVVLATHDRNLLAGLLGSGSPLSVIRLERHGNSTTAAQLPAEALTELWSEPAMRYSNVLDGLFHQIVTIAEAERDCRFYAAALDAAATAEALPVLPTDVLFLPSNGKDGMAGLVSALRAVSVEVIASPDLDVLNDEAKISKLVKALGHEWQELKPDYDLATAYFRQSREPTKVSDIRIHVEAILGELPDEASFDSEMRDQLRAAIRTGQSPWRQLKDFGDRAFRGQAAAAFARLRDALDARGVVLVLVGELEGFAPEIGVSKGKAWLPAALGAGAHELEPVRQHIRRIVNDRSLE